MFNLISEKYRALAAVLLLLLVFSGGVRLGWVLCANSKDAAELKVVKKTDKQQVKQASAVQAAAVQNASAIAQTRVIYKTVTKEVVKYARSENAALSASSVCDQRLDAEWVRIHDLAANPAAASAPAESAQPVGKADALGVIARNYETCQQWRNEVIGWQGWWASQTAEPFGN